MDHPAAADLQPALVPEALAARPATDPAGHVELEARFGEREIARPDPHLSLFSIQGLDHVKERALHVANREPAVHREALDLAEIRQARGFRRVPPVAPAGRDDVDRRLLDALHRADLHRRRVSPPEDLRGEIEGVPFLACGMARGDVPGFEVVPLGLDLGPQLDLVAEALQPRLDLPLHLREHVDVPAPKRWTWEH